MNENSIYDIFITIVIATLIILNILNIEESTNNNYKSYRDSNYTDYSKDKDYLKWLIDNPGITSNER